LLSPSKVIEQSIAHRLVVHGTPRDNASYAAGLCTWYTITLNLYFKVFLLLIEMLMLKRRLSGQSHSVHLLVTSCLDYVIFSCVIYACVVLSFVP
jgi:hypothetical protein